MVNVQNGLRDLNSIVFNSKGQRNNIPPTVNSFLQEIHDGVAQNAENELGK